MKRIIFGLLSMILIGCAAFSLVTHFKNIRYMDVERFEEKTAEIVFLPSKSDLNANCKCKGRIIEKNLLLFKSTYYELFVSFDDEKDFFAQQKKINEIYTYMDINVKGVFGGLEDHVVCEKDGFQYRIADIDGIYGYPNEFLIIGQSQGKKEFVFIFVDDEDANSVDDFNKFLKKELYI